MEINKLHILAVGRNAEIMEVVSRLINSHKNWVGTAVLTDEEAIAACGSEHYDLVLLGGGITEEEAVLLKERLQEQNSSVIVIRHYGGGSGLLENEILSVLEQYNIRLVDAGD